MNKLLIEAEAKPEEITRLALRRNDDNNICLVQLNADGGIYLYVAEVRNDGLHLYSVGGGNAIAEDRAGFVKVYRDK